MPAYAKDPRSLDALVQEFRSVRARVGVLERQVANLRGAPTSSPSPAYDANVIWNGGMESGLTGWRVSWFNGTQGKLSINNTNPIDGLLTLQVNEHAASNSYVYWNPSTPSPPSAGADVFATAPGEQWLLSASIRSSVSLSHMVLTAACGTAEGDCYTLGGANDWIAAANVPVSAGAVTTLSGLITVPASRNFVTVMLRATDLPAADWFWEVDDVSLRKKL